MAGDSPAATAAARQGGQASPVRQDNAFLLPMPSRKRAPELRGPSGVREAAARQRTSSHIAEGSRQAAAPALGVPAHPVETRGLPPSERPARQTPSGNPPTDPTNRDPRLQAHPADSHKPPESFTHVDELAVEITTLKQQILSTVAFTRLSDSIGSRTPIGGPQLQSMLSESRRRFGIMQERLSRLQERARQLVRAERERLARLESLLCSPVRLTDINRQRGAARSSQPATQNAPEGQPTTETSPAAQSLLELLADVAVSYGQQM